MCDYSLSAVKTRPAKVDDKLTTRLFGWSTRGFEQYAAREQCHPHDRRIAIAERSASCAGASSALALSYRADAACLSNQSSLDLETVPI